MKEILEETIILIKNNLRKLDIGEVTNYLIEVRDFCDNALGGSNLSKMIDENIRAMKLEEDKQKGG